MWAYAASCRSRSVRLSEPRQCRGPGAEPPDVLIAFVGKRLPLKVIEADQRRERLILSERAAAQEVRRRRKEEASLRLSEGEVLDGTVASVTTFGLFVDVGVADGLV